MCETDARPLVPLPMPDGERVDAPFWRGLERGVLRIQRCLSCRQWTWPPQWRCGRCGSWAFDWPLTGLDGIVHAFTRTHHTTLPSMRAEVPFTTLLVQLPAAGGARVLGLLRGEETALEIGHPVKGRIAYPADPGERPALQWRLARTNGPVTRI